MISQDQLWNCATGVVKTVGGVLALTLGSYFMYRGLEDIVHCFGQKLPWESG